MDAPNKESRMALIRPEDVADSEVPARPTRRRFSAEYKLSILREADACSEP